MKSKTIPSRHWEIDFREDSRIRKIKQQGRSAQSRRQFKYTYTVGYTSSRGQDIMTDPPKWSPADEKHGHQALPHARTKAPITIVSNHCVQSSADDTHTKEGANNSFNHSFSICTSIHAHLLQQTSEPIESESNSRPTSDQQQPKG